MEILQIHVEFGQPEGLYYLELCQHYLCKINFLLLCTFRCILLRADLSTEHYRSDSVGP
jgi:hypothetical protein